MAGRGVVVFDLDGTLVDTIDDLAAAASRLLATHGRPPLAAAQVRPMVGDGVPALVRRVLAATGLGIDEGEAIASFTADYQAHAAQASRPFPGAVETLTRLADAGWLAAVCTNKPSAAARTLLDALGLSPHLAAVGGGDSFAGHKPDPRHLLGTIELAGEDPGRAVLVGDHANDVAAARGADVPCVFALWGYGSPAMAEGATARAASLAEVPGLVERLI